MTRWTTDEGLPTNILLDVRQTPSGDLWISGFGGLARFDGIRFETFNQRTRPELTANSFYRVVDDGEGLWIATQSDGVWRFEDERLTPLPEHPRAHSIRALLVDRVGRLWVGSSDEGAFVLEDGELRPVEYADLTDVTVRTIFEDGAGTLWFGTEGKGLVRLVEGRFETFGEGSGLADQSISSVSEAGGGGLWIGTQGGLSRMSSGVITSVPELAELEIFHAIEDDYGSLWVAAEQGLYRRPPGAGRFESLADEQGPLLRSVNTIAFDHEGSAWISSYTHGLLQLRKGSFRNYDTQRGLSSERISSVYEWGEGRLLVGGDLGAIDLIENGEVSRFELATPLPDVRVRSFYEDSAGTLWISSYAGLLRIRDGDETLLATRSGLPVDSIRLVYEDSAGRLWVATRGAGLVRLLADGGFEAIDRSTGLASDFVLSITEGPEGVLLVGTQGGLSILGPGGEIVTYSADDGLPADLVFNAYVDDAEAIWIATAGGLARLEDGKLATFTIETGLPAASIYDYREDDLGYAWMTSGEGVLRVDKSELVELMDGKRDSLLPTLLDEGDGLANPQCTGATRMVRAADGTFWIPTLGGVSMIDPREVGGNPVPPPVLIRSLSIDGEKTVPPESADARVEIPARSLRVLFTFAALSFQAPGNVEVRYRLEGFDDEWIEAGQERSALYTSLPPGRYSFHVKAANNDGVWNPREAVVRLRVLPRYYQTPAFLALAGGALLLGPWAFFRWRAKQAQRRSRELERLLAEQRRLEAQRSQLIRQLESRNEHLRHLTYAVSHDLKSPLFTIQGFLGLLEKDRRAGDEARAANDMQRIREAVDAMSHLLQELGRMWQLESAELRPERVDVAELARRAAAAVQGRLTERGVEVEISNELPTVVADPTQLTQVLQNLIDNAAAFMGEQPEPRVEIGCRHGGAETVFFVRDNGVGIAPAFHGRVFRLFERLHPTSDGTGLGLAIVDRVVTAHGGRVWVESEGEGKGSTFCFTLGAEPGAAGSSAGSGSA